MAESSGPLRPGPNPVKEAIAGGGPGDPASHRALPRTLDGNELERCRDRYSLPPSRSGKGKAGKERCISGGKVSTGRLACADSTAGTSKAVRWGWLADLAPP